MPSEDENLADDDNCRALYSSSVHDTAMDLDLALNFGVGAGVAAVAGVSLEAGVVYGNDGCYGCYITECIGAETNIGIESYASVGFYTSYSDFQGEAIAFIEEAGEIISFSTSQVFNTDWELVGTADCLSIGVSVLPISVGVYDCVTTTDTVGCLNAAGELVEVVNNPPTAICSNAVVCAAGPPTCTANASIDGGSFDSDGDAITLSQSPSEPYSIGTTTPVTLTVLDAFSEVLTRRRLTVRPCRSRTTRWQAIRLVLRPLPIPAPTRPAMRGAAAQR
jgi:hypothetical protein